MLSRFAEVRHFGDICPAGVAVADQGTRQSAFRTRTSSRERRVETVATCSQLIVSWLF